MRRINNNEFQYIVATDIAARGIDIDGASHVINYQLPKEPDFYIHRSGRCGRGKYTGICYSLYDSTDENNLRILERRGIEFKNMGIWYRERWTVNFRAELISMDSIRRKHQDLPLIMMKKTPGIQMLSQLNYWKNSRQKLWICSQQNRIVHIQQKMQPAVHSKLSAVDG